MNANTGNQDALPYESYISACMHAAFFVVSCFFFFESGGKGRRVKWGPIGKTHVFDKSRQQLSHCLEVHGCR